MLLFIKKNIQFIKLCVGLIFNSSNKYIHFFWVTYQVQQLRLYLAYNNIKYLWYLIRTEKKCMFF